MGAGQIIYRCQIALRATKNKKVKKALKKNNIGSPTKIGKCLARAVFRLVLRRLGERERRNRSDFRGEALCSFVELYRSISSVFHLFIYFAFNDTNKLLCFHNLLLQ